MEFKFDYDSEDDVLSVFSYSCKPHESVEFSENLIFDLDKNGNFVGMEIFDASEFLGAIQQKMNKDFLKNIERVDLIAKDIRNMWYIQMAIKPKNGAVLQSAMPLLRKSEYPSPLLIAR